MKLNQLAILFPMALSMALSSGHAANATSIGINFTGNSAAGTLASADSAGVVAQTNWNNLSGFSATSGPLIDSNGANTTTTITYTGASVATFNTGAAGGDELLNNGAIAAAPSSFLNITLSNIQYAHYDVYIYRGSGAGSFQTTSRTGGASYYGISPDTGGAGYVDNNPATPYTYTLTSSTVSGPTTSTSGGNYVVFRGLSGVGQAFAISSGNYTSYVGGIQIVATPEPSSIALMALGTLIALTLLVAKRTNEFV